MDKSGIPFYIFAGVLNEQSDQEGRINIGTFLRYANSAYPQVKDQDQRYIVQVCETPDLRAVSAMKLDELNMKYAN
jgi:hypothetical protein